jgi:hypothetical protein
MLDQLLLAVPDGIFQRAFEGGDLLPRRNLRGRRGSGRAGKALRPQRHEHPDGERRGERDTHSKRYADRVPLTACP